MTTTTIRVPVGVHGTLRRLAREQGRTIGQIVADAIDHYAREHFLAAVNEAYVRLRPAPVTSADWRTKLKSLDATLLDCLADDPWVEYPHLNSCPAVVRFGTLISTL